MVMNVADQIKGSEMYNNKQAYTLPLHTPLTHGMGSSYQNSFSSSEIGHLAYQIKEKEANNKIQAKYLTLTHTLTFGVGSECQILKLCI